MKLISEAKSVASNLASCPHICDKYCTNDCRHCRCVADHAYPNRMYFFMITTIMREGSKSLLQLPYYFTKYI